MFQGEFQHYYPPSYDCSVSAACLHLYSEATLRSSASLSLIVFQSHQLSLALVMWRHWQYRLMDIWPWSAWQTVTRLQILSGTGLKPKCRYRFKWNLKQKFSEKKACSLTQSVYFHQLGGRLHRLAGGQYLEIQEVKPEDSGLYSCVVTNMAGSTSLFFTVEILCKFISQ